MAANRNRLFVVPQPNHALTLAQTSINVAAFFSIRYSSWILSKRNSERWPARRPERRSLQLGSPGEPLSYGTSGSARSRRVSPLCDAGFLRRGCPHGLRQASRGVSSVAFVINRHVQDSAPKWTAGHDRILRPSRTSAADPGIRTPPAW